MELEVVDVLTHTHTKKNTPVTFNVALSLSFLVRDPTQCFSFG